MALKKFNPTSPGTRFMTALTFDEITKSAAGEVAHRAPQEDRRARQPRPHHRAVHRRRPQAALPHGGLPARQARASRPRWRPSSTTPTARRASPCCTTRTARSATSSGRRGPGRGRPAWSPARAPTSCPATRLPLNAIPAGTMIHNIELRHGKGGADGAQRGRGRPARGQGRRLRAGEAALGRDAPGHVDCQATVGQVGNIEHKNVSLRQGGPPALAGPAAPQPRRGHEPRRPSARRRRGQDLGRPPPGDARGASRPRAPRRATTSAPRSSSSRGGSNHGTFTEEGPVHRRPPDEEDRRDERGQRAQGREDLVAPLHHHARRWSATRSPSTTAASSSPSTSPRTWSATSSASSRPRARSRATPPRWRRWPRSRAVPRGSARRGRAAPAAGRRPKS